MKLKEHKGPGRPTVIDDSVILKLETAFALGCIVKEALAFAGLSKDSYSRFLRRQPEYRERFEQLRDKPILQARKQVVDAIGDGDTTTARWYLERKRSDEFSAKASLEVNVKHEMTENEILKRLAKYLDPAMLEGMAVEQDPETSQPLIEHDSVT